VLLCCFFTTYFYTATKFYRLCCFVVFLQLTFTQPQNFTDCATLLFFYNLLSHSHKILPTVLLFFCFTTYFYTATKFYRLCYFVVFLQLTFTQPQNFTDCATFFFLQLTFTQPQNFTDCATLLFFYNT
jgi:hypothetical protein